MPSPLERLKELESAATPGPWKGEKSCFTMSTGWVVYRPDPMRGGMTAHVTPGDACFTATIRNLAPEILAVLEAVEKAGGDNASPVSDAMDAFHSRAAEVLGEGK